MSEGQGRLTGGAEVGYDVGNSSPRVAERPPSGFCFSPVRAVAFVDGMNLFNAAKTAFGYHYPNFDPMALAEAICALRGWHLEQTRFYTGLPREERDPGRHRFWVAKLAAMSRQGVATFHRLLRYDVDPPHRGHEKGIDVRIALDLVRLAHEGAYDAALVFSQDQDLSEAVLDVYAIAKKQCRHVTIASVYPPNGKRGINRTLHIEIARATYDACIDPHDYRPAASPLILPELAS